MRKINIDGEYMVYYLNYSYNFSVGLKLLKIKGSGNKSSVQNAYM